MRLTKLSTKGLKGQDLNLDLGPVHVLAGPNGSSKSAAILAVHLLVTGKLSTPDKKATALDSGVMLPSTNDGIMSLARGKSIELFGVWEEDGAKPITVRRAWKRSRGGTIKETIDLTGIGSPEMTAKEQKVVISQALAPTLDLFFPANIVALGADKLRSKLLRAVAADLGDASRWTNEKLPKWAQPSVPDEDPLDWIGSARGQASKRLTEARAELRQAETVYADLEDAWGDIESPDAIQDRIARIREEGEAATARENAAKRLDEMRAQLKRHEAALSVADAQALVDEAEAKANEAAAARKAYAEHSGQVMRLRQEVADATRKMLDAKAAAGGEEATTGDLDAAKMAEASARQDHAQAEGALREAEALVKALSGDCALPECPECHADLRPHMETARAAAEALRSAAAKAEAVTSDAAFEAARALGLAEAGIQYAAALLALETTEKAMAGLEAREPPKPDEGTEGALQNARRALAEADAAAAHRETLEVEIEIAEAELADMPEGRDRDALALEYRAAEADLEALGRKNARKEQHGEAKEGVEIATERVDDVKGHVERLAGIHQEMLASAVSLIEGRFQAATGAPVTVALEDERGNPDCKIQVSGFDVTGLSGGEMRMWLAANVMVFAPTSGAKWAPLIQDGIEAVSIDKREAYLAALVEAQQAGVVSQVLLSGCPDSVPAVDGVTVTQLGGEAETMREVA